MIILPVLCWLLIFSFLLCLEDEMGLRAAALWTCALWGTTLATITEILSLFESLTHPSLALCWAGVAGVAASGVWWRWPPPPRTCPTLRALAPSTLAIAASIGMVVLLTGIIALFAPPNNWDSMTYHMSRVMHWAQNRSIRAYATHVPRQIYLSPWAEYVILHFYLLGAGDRLANLVQWFSMLGSLLAVSLIARHLGATVRGQWLSALFCATLPMGILQSSTTQNDYVVAFWLLCGAYALLAINFPHTLPSSLAVGASFGLALLTKGTAGVFGAPLALVAAPPLARMLKENCAVALRNLCIALLVGVALDAGLFTRNYKLLGSILRPPPRGDYTAVNNAFTVGIFASNVLRNTGLQFSTPVTRVNAGLEGVIRAFHTWFGLDINDPRSTWPSTVFHVEPLHIHEDLAGNPLHVVVIIVTSGLAIVARRRRTGAICYGVAVLGGFFMFCLLLKWQPWHSRLQLPLFVLWSPLFGVVWERYGSRLPTLISVILVASSVPYLLASESRPLIGSRSVLTTPRIDTLFRNRPPAKAAYLAATQFVRSRSCWDVGLVCASDDWEYPLWVLLPELRARGRLEHVAVSNFTARWADQPANEFQPCAVIVMGSEAPTTLSVAGRDYQSAWSQDDIHVLLPTTQGDNSRALRAPG